MPDISQINCPKCKSRLLLKFAKKDGIQCKRCYYFIPSEEMNEIIGKEEQKARVKAEAEAAAVAAAAIPETREEKRTTRCPKCRSTVEYTKLTDGGIMCKKCYHWITVEGEQIKEEPNPKDLKPYSPPVIAYIPPSRDPQPVKQMEVTEKTSPETEEKKSEDPELHPSDMPEMPEQRESIPEVEEQKPEVISEDMIPVAEVAEEEADYEEIQPEEEIIGEKELFPTVEKGKKNLYSVDESLLDEIMNPQSEETKTVMELVPDIEIETVEEEESQYSGLHEPEDETGEEYADEISAEPEIPIEEESSVNEELPQLPPVTDEADLPVAPVIPDEEKVIKKLAVPEFKALPKPIGSGDLKKIQSVFSSRTFDIRKITKKPPGTT